MPIPTPHKDEKEQEFISRCMGNDTMVEEYPDNKVRSGICYTQWQRKGLSEWIDCLQLSNGAEPRDEIMLFPFGEFDHPAYGKLKFDNDFFNEIITNYQNNVMHTKPFMDRQHDEDKALAWFDSSPYIRPGIGLFIKPDYTELGMQTLQSRTYRYFSPSWGKYKDPQSGKEFKNVLMGGAATNIPFLKTMPPIIDETAVLDAKGMAEIKLSDLTARGSLTAEGQKADNSVKQKPPVVNKLSKGGNMIDKLRKKFGLSDDASEDAILSKIDEIVNINADLTKKVEDIEKKVNGDKALTEELNETKKQLTTMQIKIVEKDRDEVITKALSDGKILPADKEYWEKRFMSDPENIKQDLEKMSKVVDFKEIGSSKEGKKLSDDPGKQLVDEVNKLAAEKKISFDAAYKEVYKNNPQLVDAYNKAYRA